jgi:DNA-binding transcriptional ArsR family regulator
VIDVAPADAVFKALADPTRRALVDLLRDTDLSVSELTRPFAITQPAISQHLAVLRRAGLIRGRKAGRRRVYRIEPEPFERLERWAGTRLTDPAGHVWSLQPRRPFAGKPGRRR